ncbi:MAG: hypothetical protein R3F11_21410 [Verrucomicrobiales bacterium]
MYSRDFVAVAVGDQDVAAGQDKAVPRLPRHLPDDLAVLADDRGLGAGDQKRMPDARLAPLLAEWLGMGGDRRGDGSEREDAEECGSFHIRYLAADPRRAPTEIRRQEVARILNLRALDMGMPNKVQLIKRNQRAVAHQLPQRIAQTMEFEKVGRDEWIISDKSHLILQRKNAPPDPVEVKKARS